jgi:hypothetical protein
MRFAKRLLMVTGAVALTGLLGVAIAPKAAHAIVATVVQVANTTANPAITQGVPNLASQIVTLTASVGADSFTKVAPFYQVPPQGGSSGTVYVTPSTQSLVITSIEFAPTDGSGNLNLQFLNGFSAETYEQWKISADSITNLQYPTGIVIGPNVASVLVPFSGSTTASFNVYLHGYLTGN